MLTEWSAKIVGFIVFNYWAKLIVLAFATVIFAISLAAQDNVAKWDAWQKENAPKIQSGEIAVFDYDKCTIDGRTKIYCPTK